MRRFAYERPRTLAQVTSLLADAGEGARILAGGTDLVVGLRDGSIEPTVVVDLKWVDELGGDTIVAGDGVLTFGALATMGQIERDARVLARAAGAGRGRTRGGFGADPQPCHAGRQHLQRLACRGHRAPAARLRRHRRGGGTGR